MLEFGVRPPISYTDFISLCKTHLNLADFRTIERVNISPGEDTEDPSYRLREWKRFNTTLRNEMAWRRTLRYGKEPSRYIRGEGLRDPSLSIFAQWVLSQDSPLEAELSLDRMRWDRIEELKKGHYFDIDCLITYALQLQILERWDRINSGDGMQVLQELLEKGI